MNAASFYNAGWRPASGWLVVVGVALVLTGGLAGWWAGKDLGPLLNLYAAILGPAWLVLVGVRTAEKKMRINRDTLKEGAPNGQ